MNFKELTKNSLSKINLWYPIYFLAKIPAIFKWVMSGCLKDAPTPVKMKVVEYYVKSFNVSQFIETGTYYGNTLEYISKSNVQCISIELSESLYRQACEKFKNYKNVRLVQGDSGKKIPELLTEITQPALFWLDGHYSSGVTAMGDLATPISAELEAILRHPVKQHVILIDDARCFNGCDGYPHLDDLLHVVREEGSYTAEVSADIVRLTPRE
jgi:hypothetical protein